MQQRLPSVLYPPLAFAHRGASDRAHENTMAAFTLAVELGATGVESDVWSSADGVLVLDHDGVVRSGLRRKPIATIERAALPEHIPTLAELLASLDEHVHVSLDLKAPGIGAAVVAVAAQQAPSWTSRLWLCSPSFDELARLREEAPTARLVHSTRLRELARGPERHAADLAAAGIDVANFHHTDWTGGLVALYHRFERLAFAWDLQFDNLLENVVRMGIDGVYSNHVDVMLDIIAAECPALPG